MWIVPLIRAEAGQHKHEYTDYEVCGDHIQPNLYGKWVEEGKQTRALPLWSLEQNADTQVHEGLGEVNHLLPQVVDCQ